MKKILINLISFASVFVGSTVYAGFTSYLDVKIDNTTNYSIDNISQNNDERGKLLYITSSSVAAKTLSAIADFRMNFLGQLSQDLTFDLINDSSSKAGTCNLHLGVGSYAARPDFTGSLCILNNGDYLQLNPTYQNSNNSYHVSYKLTKSKSFSRIILFGDSMSDNGNLYKRSVELSLIFPISPILPVSPPYYKGRFTNGKVWVEHLSSKLNIPDGSLMNYAYAGASIKKDYMPIPHLDKQLNTYLNWNRTGDPYALYVVWMGANDLLRINGRADDTLMNDMLSGVEYNLRRLIDHGARHILAPQLPDISLAPDILEKDQENGSTEYSTHLKYLATRYNKEYMGLISRLQTEFPDINFMSFDVFKFLNDAKEKAHEFGFKVIDERCNPNSYWADDQATCQLPRQYVFWDGVHPTAKAHEILGELMYKLVSKSGYEPNVKHLKQHLPDDFTVRNQQAIRELHKDIDQSNRKALVGQVEHLKSVVDNNIPLL